MLQPNKKSFPYYVKRGYEYASKKTLKSRSVVSLLNQLSSIDDGILILDDIFDESEIRNGNPCLYKKIGFQGAIIEAELLKEKSSQIFLKLMDKLEVSLKNRLEIFRLLSEFFICIYTGEQINLMLDKEKNISDKSIKKYFEMVSLFTGGHIKYSLEIGQLLANKKIDKDLSKISVSLGIIRQICDDFDDYFISHHEPFGDFKTESNRLPEIIFKKLGGERKYAIDLLSSGEVNKFRELVLSNNVRKIIYSYCKKEEDKIKTIKTKFDYSDMLEDFKKIINKY